MEKTNFLLDTHIFIWWMENDKKLSKEIISILSEPNDQVFLSVVSVWEIIIKQAKKRLKVPDDIEGGIHDSGFKLIPITLRHVLAVKKLPFYHKDPFDRMLIAQAKAENLNLITTDQKIKKYDILTT